MAKNKAARTKAADEGSMLKLLRDIVVILILVLGIHSRANVTCFPKRDIAVNALQIFGSILVLRQTS